LVDPSRLMVSVTLLPVNRIRIGNPV